jgi:class 3 adenylate cyclase
MTDSGFRDRHTHAGLQGILFSCAGLMGSGLPTGTVTFLFSDIEGSTELSRRHGAAYGDLRAEHRRLLRESFGAHGGCEVDAEGDAFFVVFERAIDAVAAAVAAQRALAAADVVRVRMGLHTTEPHLHADGYVGVGVSRAARICAAAHGGQIVLSHATAGVIEDHEVPGVAMRDLGDHYLKDIPRPQRLFQIDADGLRSDFPPLGTRAAAGSIATLLFIDLAGWRRVMHELGDDGASAAAAVYHDIVGEVANANDGSLVERAADQTMCVFSSAKNAIAAAAAIRAALRSSDWIRGTEKPEVAAAIHTGRIAGRPGGQLGSPALRVVQLCELAEPGQVLVSHSTQGLLEGEVLGELVLRDLGERELPGMPAHRVLEVPAPS